MKIEIYVFPKPGILDSAGNATVRALHNLGFNSVDECRIGKYFLMEISDNSKDLEKQIRTICDELLVNPITEDYSFKIMK